MKQQDAVSNMPESLGPYRLLRRLGHGGMSQVFLGVRYGASGFEKQLAIKTLLADQLHNKALMQSLIKEARLCAQLTHRNLVQVYDLGVDQGYYYLSMEFVDGQDLSKFLSDQNSGRAGFADEPPHFPGSGP